MTKLDRRALLSLSAGALCVAAPAAAQQASPLTRTHNPEDAAREERIHNDWGNLRRYAEANAALKASNARVDVVFMGDSITEGWVSRDPSFFSEGRIPRGISGQTTPQMLVRFRQDVLDLNPRFVHIMAATNDFAGNTGPMTTDQTFGFFQSMTELAQAHGVRVILASIPPALNFPWRPGIEPAVPIMALNARLKTYAESVGAVYADYHSAMCDAAGGMREGMAYDGVHPDNAGYAVMRPIAEAALTSIARRRASRLRR